MVSEYFYLGDSISTGRLEKELPRPGVECSTDPVIDRHEQAKVGVHPCAHKPQEV